MSTVATPSSAWKGILLGGAIAGVLDIIFAFIFYGSLGTPPVRILQSCSSSACRWHSSSAGFPLTRPAR